MFPYVENHNFYIEHWSLSVFWRQIRELGQVLADAGFWADADDIFYAAPRRAPAGALRLRQRLGASAPSTIGPYHWPAEIARRKAIVAALSSASRRRRR